MMIELYHFWDSPCCFKVRFLLAEKQLEWKEHLVTTYKFDHFQPDYQALNPHSVVPTLKHDDKVILQSGVISEYLDEVFLENGLKPEDPFERAVMRQWTHDEQAYLFPLIIIMSFNVMMTLREKAFGMAQLTKWSKRHPDQTKAQGYLNRISSPMDKSAVNAAADNFAGHMNRLEEQMKLSSGPWVCGNTFSLADLSLAPLLDRMEYLDLLSVLDGAPRVAEWFACVKERPAFGKAAPDYKFRMWGPLKPIPSQQVSAADVSDGTFPGRSG